MNIRVLTRSEEEVEKCDYRESIEIQVVTQIGTTRLSFHDGEPEDATLARNFNDVYLIAGALEIAHAAGKRGENIVIEFVNTDDI